LVGGVNQRLDHATGGGLDLHDPRRPVQGEIAGSSGYVSPRSQPPGTEHLGRVLSFICLPRMSFVERKKTMAVCPAFR
jgi:hypothetical protein